MSERVSDGVAPGAPAAAPQFAMRTRRGSFNLMRPHDTQVIFEVTTPEFGRLGIMLDTDDAEDVADEPASAWLAREVAERYGKRTLWSSDMRKIAALAKWLEDEDNEARFDLAMLEARIADKERHVEREQKALAKLHESAARLRAYLATAATDSA